MKDSHEQDHASSPVAPTRKRKREEQEIDIADRVFTPRIFPFAHSLIAFQPPVDFFGRLVTPKPGELGGSTAVEPGKAFKVTYKYNEGMSAAVRKPVKISALLT